MYFANESKSWSLYSRNLSEVERSNDNAHDKSAPRAPALTRTVGGEIREAVQ
jgi:hypothetical protein